jgi:vacuolar-type H+-ATPase catalytic subunit A/Vma1
MKRILLLAAALALADAGAIQARADALDADLVQDAAHGDTDALREVFQQSLAEGPGSQAYGRQLREIFLTVGNRRFTAVLKSEPRPIQRRVVFFLNAAMTSH